MRRGIGGGPPGTPPTVSAGTVSPPLVSAGTFDTIAPLATGTLAAAAGATTGCVGPMRGRRSAIARYWGSRSFHHASIGAATKIDEYEPMNSPAASASAKSSSDLAPNTPVPTISNESTGISATNEVDSERISTWLSEVLTISPYVTRPVAVMRRWFSRTLSNTTTVS